MPAKQRGISASEKRDRILRIFTEKKEVFSYPQIEKEAEKVGIRRDVVKEILESLISDNLVETDNMGTSKCYWSLPSQALLRLQQKCQEYSEKIEMGRQKQIELEFQFEQSKVGREQSEERSQFETQIEQMRQQLYELNKELEIKQRNDPERLQKLKKEAQTLKDEANNWTDNVNQLKYYLKSQAGMSQTQLEQLGIPEELDNI